MFNPQKLSKEIIETFNSLNEDEQKRILSNCGLSFQKKQNVLHQTRYNRGCQNMNFIEVTTKGGNKVLINIEEISDIIDTIEDGRCVICLKNPETYYATEESYEEIKMKLLRFAGIG